MINLSNPEGISRLSGKDKHGNTWIQFEVDYLALQEDGCCSICNASLSSGWQCLDGGEEVCDKHVDIKMIETWTDGVNREHISAEKLQDRFNLICIRFGYNGGYGPFIKISKEDAYKKLMEFRDTMIKKGYKRI